MQQALLLPLVKALRREAKQIHLAISPPIIEGLGEALARGQIDLAVTIPEFAMSDLRHGYFNRERYVVVVRPQHLLARGAAMTVERFCNYDHILVSPTGGSFEGPADQALARLRLRRKVRYSVPSFLLMPELLQTDDLVALVPARLLRENSKRLVVLKPPVEVPGFDVIAVWHPRVDEDIAHRWLRKRLAGRSERIPGRPRCEFEVADIGTEPQADARADRYDNDIAGAERGHAKAANDISRAVDAGEALIDRLGRRKIVD
jgi:DNA-binding transcriptional LysR family regulator